MAKTKQKPERLPNGTNRRDAHGRFLVGCAPGPGNPHARQVAVLRSELLSVIKPNDIRAIVTKLISKAKNGDLAAIKETLDRAVGRPCEMDFMERLEGLEKMLSEIEKK